MLLDRRGVAVSRLNCKTLEVGAKINSQANPNKMEIGVVGLGKLGLAWALVLADAGYQVHGIDKDPGLCERIIHQNYDHGEPRCKELISKHLGYTLKISQSVTELGNRIDTVFIVVPTPSDLSDRFDPRYAIEAVRDVARQYKTRKHPLSIVLVSTVMPGDSRIILESVYNTSEELLDRALLLYAYNPEFIALGSVIKDMLSPDLVLIGSDHEQLIDSLGAIYRRINGDDVNICSMSIESAEVTKLGINTFLTLKISFANLIGVIASRIPNADAIDITRAIGQDTRIGNKYLSPGLGFGGPCLPRDTKAFSNLCQTIGIHPYLSNAADHVNDLVANTALYEIRAKLDALELTIPPVIGICGITYKSESWLLEASHQFKIVTRIKQILPDSKIVIYDDKAKLIGLHYSDSLDRYSLLISDEIGTLLAQAPSIIVLLNKPGDDVYSRISSHIDTTDDTVLLDLTKGIGLTNHAKIDSYNGSDITVNTVNMRRSFISRGIYSDLTKWYTTTCGAELDSLHTMLTSGENSRLASKATDQFSTMHAKVHKAYDKDPYFLSLYQSLIGHVIEIFHPSLLSCDKIIVQSYPTIRIQYPDNISVFEFHKDMYYAHPTCERNHFLALTDCVETSALWRETNYSDQNLVQPTFTPVNLHAGEIVAFDTSSFWHGDLPNLTTKTRVSIDFRILEDDSQLTGKRTLSGKASMSLGSYYSLYSIIKRAFV
jgi:UDPglucose 6-dehydrogenase